MSDSKELQSATRQKEQYAALKHVDCVLVANKIVGRRWTALEKPTLTPRTPRSAPVSSKMALPPRRLNPTPLYA